MYFHFCQHQFYHIIKWSFTKKLHQDNRCKNCLCYSYRCYSDWIFLQFIFNYKEINASRSRKSRYSNTFVNHFHKHSFYIFSRISIHDNGLKLGKRHKQKDRNKKITVFLIYMINIMILWLPAATS